MRLPLFVLVLGMLLVGTGCGSPGEPSSTLGTPPDSSPSDQSAPIAVLSHGKSAVCLAYSRTRDEIATAGDDEVIRIWSVASLQQVSTFPIASEKVFSLTYAGTPDVPVVFLAKSADLEDFGPIPGRLLALHSSPGGKTQSQVLYQGRLVPEVATQPGGHLIGLGTDKGAVFFDLRDPTRVRRVPGSFSFMSGLTIDSDGRRLATWNDDDRLRVWDTESLALVADYQRPDGGEHSVTFASDGSIWVVQNTGINSSPTYVWRAGESPEPTELAYDLSPMVLSWSPEARLLGLSGRDRSVTILDRASSRVIKIFPHPDEGPIVTSLAWSPDGKKVAYGRDDGSIFIRRVER